MPTVRAPRALATTALVLSALYVAPLAAQQAPDSASHVAADTSRAGDVVGSSRVVLDSAALAGAPMRTFSDALAARVPGLSVLRSSGTVGAGSRVRLRSAGGGLTTDEPLLVIDGVRAEGEQASLNVDAGGQQPSRLDDVAPEDVERIEILKGPAAAWRYGTGAANGALVVTTRRGRQGPARWHLLATQGVMTERTDFPANYGTPGIRTLDGAPTDCPRDYAATGWCVPHSPMQSWNPLERASPFRGGRQQQAAASVTGGARLLSYYASAGLRDERGVLDDNHARRATVRANLGLRPRDDLRLALAAGYVDGRTRLPRGDRGGVLFDGLLGLSADDPAYRGYAPALQTDIAPVRQDVGRLTASLSTDWRPRPWLGARGTVGIDNINRLERHRFQFGRDEFADTVAEEADAHNRRLTMELEATASYALARRLTGRTSVGIERARARLFEHLSARVNSAIFGTIEAGWSIYPEVTTTGLFARQHVTWPNRLEASVGLRTDANRIGDLELQRAVYPTVDAAWTVYAARPGGRARWLEAVRVRAAYGEAGDLRPYLVPPSAAALTPGSVGRPLPVPPNPAVQRSRERELGVDLRLFAERARLELTHFRKSTGDVWLLIPDPQPSSSLSPDILVLVKDAWRNAGIEATLAARLVDRGGLTWDATAGLATNRSEVLTDILRARMPAGEPLGGYWVTPYRFADANGDGVIAATEVRPDTHAGGVVPRVYAGPLHPSRELSLASEVRIADRVTVGAQLDHRGGHRKLNQTGELRCLLRVCRASHDPATTLAEQARVILATRWDDGPYGHVAFLEDGSFTRLRELSATVELPAGWWRAVGARGASLTLAGRNLATWTSYTGLDPEVSATGQRGTAVFESFTQPLLRSVAARLDVSW